MLFSFKHLHGVSGCIHPLLFLEYSGEPRDLPSFPTRRSSDLEGNQVAFVQMADGEISQSLSFPVSGTYILSILASQTGVCNSPRHVDYVLDVYLDNNIWVGSIAPTTTDYHIFTVLFSTTAGMHQLDRKSTALKYSNAIIAYVVIT